MDGPGRKRALARTRPDDLQAYVELERRHVLNPKCFIVPDIFLNAQIDDPGQREKKPPFPEAACPVWRQKGIDTAFVASGGRVLFRYI